MERTILLIDSNRGIYIPQYFAKEFSHWPISADDSKILENTDHEYYWQAWDNVLATSKHVDKEGHTWLLYQDGDLWAVREDLFNDDSDEYKKFFGYED